MGGGTRLYGVAGLRRNLEILVAHWPRTPQIAGAIQALGWVLYRHEIRSPAETFCESDMIRAQFEQEWQRRRDNKRRARESKARARGRS